MATWLGRSILAKWEKNLEEIVSERAIKRQWLALQKQFSELARELDEGKQSALEEIDVSEESRTIEYDRDYGGTLL